MIDRPKLSKAQWVFMAHAAGTFGNGILLGASAAFFLPETLQMKEPINVLKFILLLFIGLIVIGLGVIMIKKGRR